MKQVGERVKGAWLVMDISEVVETSSSVSMAHGTIVGSNFLSLRESNMPVVASAFNNVNPGDRVKMVYFTTRAQIEDFIKGKTRGFVDTGLRYQRLGPDGWELLYEDWSENPKEG